jgi:selenium-dependent xanthine dehydrogenase
MKFYVNGAPVETGELSKKLLPFLREDLGLTGTKDGCGEGACGACMVLVDGKARRACTLSLSRLEGKSIVTIEGLSPREREVYAGCFAEAGAVQCGFCTPGMVISAKALLDRNNNPARGEVKEAIRGNLCRCTGYKKIEEAILACGRYFRENLPAPPPEDRAAVDMRFKRVDAAEKTLGRGMYCDDLRIENMAFARALRSRYPRARINRIDTAAAEGHPDCLKILTARDVPCNKIGHLVQDWDVMIPVGETTRYIGDALALAVSRRQESLAEILALIEVDYTELKPVTSPAEALRADAPLIHAGGNVMSREYLKRGDAAGAIRDSKYVVTRKYYTPFNDHAFMEPECAVALPEGEGLRVYSGGQSVYDEQREISLMLALPPEQIRVISMLVGGGFGGKEDMSVQHHAALAAWKTGLPVKVKFSRQESINCHTKRHAMDMEFTTACDENGILTAMKALLIADTGAYASLGGPVLQRACTHAAGPYNFQNIDILGLAVYTNNVVAGAYRGFGVTQSCFAMESNINLLAEMAGLSPWEIRYRNAIRPGQVLPNGQIAEPNTALAETLEAVKEIYESHPYAGIACAFKNSGKGVGLRDTGRCILSAEGGKLHIRTSAACMGQGMATVCVQILCETLGLDPRLVVHERPDTVRTPDSGTSTASRQTLITGEAVRRAALSLAEAAAGRRVEELLAQGALEGREFYGEYAPVTDPLGAAVENPVSHVSYSYATQVVILDGEGKVEKVAAAYDVGTPVNIQALEGQIEGGVVMGLGFALTEDFPIKEGVPQGRLGTLGLIRAPEAPPIEVILVRHGREKLPLAYGAKGVGELCLIPTSPAAAHAYYRLDGTFRSRLPLRPNYYKDGPRPAGTVL